VQCGQGSGTGTSTHVCGLPLQIDVATGEKYYQAVAFRDGKMVPGDWKRWAAPLLVLAASCRPRRRRDATEASAHIACRCSNGPRQRVHEVEERDDGM
jgi:hypothetical protein